MRAHQATQRWGRHEQTRVTACQLVGAQCLARARSLEAQILFTAIVKSACLKDDEGMDTLGQIYKCFRWSLAACLAGFHPPVDWDGEPWPPGSQRAKLANKALNPQGKFLAAFHLLGDLDELCNQYGLRHFNSRECCFWCKANTGTLPWTDFRPTAGWRKTLEKPRREMVAPSDHEIWQLPGMSVFSVSWDVLHGLDLGPTQHVIGNCLEDLMQLKLPGQSQSMWLGVIWETAQQLYKEAGIANRLAYLDINRFRHGGEYPRLRAKGNESRHFLPVLQALMQKYDKVDSPYTRARNRMLVSLIQFYQVLDTPNPLLSQQQAEEGKTHLLQWLKDYSWLSAQALEQGQLRWQITVKFHYVAHAAELLQFYNPKYTSTYAGESFVGKISKIALSASYGKPSYSLGGLLMNKLQASRAIRKRKYLT